MRKTWLYLSSIFLLTLGGCTKNFTVINTDPTQASASVYDPNLLLPSAELGYMGADQGYSGPLLFQSMWMQIFASAEYPSYYSNGDKYVASSNILTYDASTWNDAYTAAGEAYTIQTLIKENKDTALGNLNGISLIVELLNFELVTDTYGDCPYTDAVQGASGVTQPKYDTQQAIYTSMLAKLDSVIPTLNAGATIPTNDIIYKGNIAEWQKFGYSLMLRMAMRLTKADAATAQTYAEKAYAGGVFSSISDDAYITFDHTDGFSNGNSSALQVQEDYSEVKWGQMLISYLKTNNDPRLPVIAEVPQPGNTNAANESLAGNSTPAAQFGMPNGYDENGGATDITNAPSYPGSTGTGTDANPTGGYSRPTSAVYLALNTPGFILTYAQTELLLAEAAARGWNVGASASQHYANGLAAALQTYGTFNGTTPISAVTATAYATANPLDVSSTTNSLAMINTQYWVTLGTLFDFSEAWSNWRRSGYPVLTPVNYAGNFTNATIPRREIYPSSEGTTDPANYAAAVKNLSGGDTWTAKVWWDQ
jgi:Starch-binding associating with outer membrane